MKESYVIVRNDGKFVTIPGMYKSHTKDLLAARRFSSTLSANRERCVENERVVCVDDLLQPIAEGD